MQAALARPRQSTSQQNRRATVNNKRCRPRGVRLTSGVSRAPKDDGTILILLGTENVVKANGEAVEVANVQGAKVVVKGIVEEGIINRKVARRRAAARRRRNNTTFGDSLGSLSRRLGRRREECVGRGRVDIGPEVESVWEAWHRSASVRATASFVQQLTGYVLYELAQVLGVAGGGSHCKKPALLLRLFACVVGSWPCCCDAVPFFFLCQDLLL